MGSEHYCLRWNNHQSNLLGVFSQLLRDESLVDVTLACSEGHSIRAHKVVLSACSSYFQTLFIDHPSRHPIVILKDVRFAELRTLIEFMYKGEVNVEYCQLSALLQTAESLKVKGLAEMTNLGPGNTSATTATSTNVLAPSVLKGDHPPPQLGEHSPEQTEPTELVSKKQTPPNVPPPPTITTTSTPILSNSGSTTSSCSTTLVTAAPSSLPPLEEQHPLLLSHSSSSRASPLMGASNRVSTCRNHSPERSDSVETVRAIDSPTPIDEDDDDDDKCEPSDMTCGEKDRSLQQNNGSACPSTTTLCSRLPSPISSEPVPGPSNMPPVQQVPLSLKKEVDWGGGSADDKSIGESSSDYPRHCHDPSTDVERCFNSPTAHLDRPPSTHSSRSSTPFALPYPSLATSLLEVGLMHPALIGDEMFRCTACMAAFPSIWLLEQHTALQHIGSLNAAVNVAAVAAAAAAAAASGGSGGGGSGGPGCGSVDKPFVCEQCGQSYRYRSAYVKHREQNHRARLPADKLFSCDVCGMQFRYLKSFKKHRLNHALERLHGKTSSEASTETRPDCGLPSTTSRLDRDSQSQSHLENSSDQVSSSNETITVTEDTDTAATAVTLPSGQDLETAIPTLAIVKREVLDPADEPMATTTMDETPGCSSDTERVLSTDLEQDDTIDSFSLARISAAAALASASSGSNPLSLTQLPSGLEVSAGDLSAVYRNAQEASIINFLRADAAERQRERRFACPFCGKCVRSKENLKLHVRKHTGERPFVCLFCGRAFGGKSDLTRHLRIHTGERPYHCDMCGKCFARADYLSKHLTTHINTPR